MQRFTANFSRSQVEGRFPFELTDRDWLISIADRNAAAADVKGNFDQVFHFGFDDCDESDTLHFAMREHQAEKMAQIIRDAAAQNKNVWVNCHAGMCRSGAVVEVLGLLGWTIVDDFSQKRLPNVHVFKSLRLQFDELKHSHELDDKMKETWSFCEIRINSLGEDDD